MKGIRLFALCLLAIVGVILAACAGREGPPGPQGPQGEQGPPGEVSVADLSCTDCHDDTARLTAKRIQWIESLHGSGDAFAYAGGRQSCTGCHSGAGFSARIAAGLNPDEVEEGFPEPTRQDCRACHQIHTTYTGDDFALETTDPVVLFASEETFDMGLGNLCANCHQPREVFPDAVDGQVKVDTTHWGPHHGVESAMLLGIGGALVDGTPSGHALMVTDGCVTCHMGEGRNHSMEPQIAACQACHTGLEDFDRNGVQTAISELESQLEEALIAAGLLDEEGHPVVGTYPEALAGALWNYIFVAEEDASLGVHNSIFAEALLRAGLDALEE